MMGVNTINGIRYNEDSTIMSWQLSNEPGVGDCSVYKTWIENTAGFIKDGTKYQLVSVGNEGSITPCHTTTWNIKEVDYVTFHAWAQNWGWYSGSGPVDSALMMAKSYILGNIPSNKPSVLEEFGLAGDSNSYDPTSPTTAGDNYYAGIFDIVYREASEGKTLSGVNFWAYGGYGRPRKNGDMWVPGDPLIGDPPHERQGWYTVYDTDKSTHEVIGKYSDLMTKLRVTFDVSDDMG